tara:strand:+ start:515 stop:718 length:204 start_codon:yes stop_codon:yes gene_type:complete
MSDSEKKFIDTRQLAERWMRSHRTIENWRNQKKGPAYLKLAGKIVYDMDEILKEEEKAKVSNEARLT